MFYYQAYNLTIQTPFTISELPTIPSQTTDILIIETSVVETLTPITNQENYFHDFMTIQKNHRQLLIKIKGIAKFYVPDTQTIHIQRDLGVSDSDVALYLLGSCLACLNMLRGCFALHGSAILTERGSILFIGASGVGKSTTAAKMIAKGYQLQSDDVSFITFDTQNQATVSPAYPQLKLWDTSLEKLGMKKDDLDFVSPIWQKFRVAAHDNFTPHPTPLAAIYELSPSEQDHLTIQPLYRFDKMKVLLENTYRNYTIKTLGLEKQHFNFCSLLAAKTTLKSIKRPKNKFLLDELIEAIERDLKVMK